MEPELNIGPTVTPVAGSSPRAGIVMSWTVMGPRPTLTVVAARSIWGIGMLGTVKLSMATLWSLS
ncbi:hypothetical protein K871_07397 [Mycobacterium tuberculosis TKK-01-0047]|uniref:hypothetical protein n=1 Tax=Mycobacterium tuberculosis TaxID=1773 RepID=UPI00045B9F9F|nr:hypothetical protein K871_07397 [Mycobacterium tuberculosis TKK-01-0047]